MTRTKNNRNGPLSLIGRMKVLAEHHASLIAVVGRHILRMHTTARNRAARLFAIPENTYAPSSDFPGCARRTRGKRPLIGRRPPKFSRTPDRRSVRHVHTFPQFFRPHCRQCPPTRHGQPDWPDLHRPRLRPELRTARDKRLDGFQQSARRAHSPGRLRHGDAKPAGYWLAGIEFGRQIHGNADLPGRPKIDPAGNPELAELAGKPGAGQLHLASHRHQFGRHQDQPATHFHGRRQRPAISGAERQRALQPGDCQSAPARPARRRHPRHHVQPAQDRPEHGAEHCRLATQCRALARTEHNLGEQQLVNRA